ATAIAEHAPEASHSGIHVALAAERLGTFMGIPITNTLITAWVVMAVLITLAWLVRRKLSLVPGKLQLLFEEVIEFIHGFVRDTLENDSLARKVLPLLLTLFLFIFFSNALEFVPGVGSVGFYHPDPAGHGETFHPLFRSVNTDLNVTLALTIIVVLVIEFLGIITLGFFAYAGKFINFSSPVNFFVGIIELVGELARLVSFSFRLFGNIFAGEVLIGVAIFFLPYIVPSGLIAFELFVGFVQAAIFTLLTLFFIKLAVTDPHAAH
ncbi:MAG: F0F1 ATP synthase subunit A, partial [Candidatus Pacebacteria bacterium]|nr:F0F1 ATP synthase subunit A [Candidatus Paceibacterota bacterium]